MPAEIASASAEGAYVHGLYMEGARWDGGAAGIVDEFEEALGQTTVPDECNGSIAESKPKELYPYMPMMHITARTANEAIPQDRVTKGRFICPFYMTTIRGPTFVFSGPLRTNVHAFKWILAGACLVMQPD